MSHSNPERRSLSESMLQLIESAPQVKRRYQFFLWTQAEVQRWIPHKLLVCGAYDRGCQEMVLDIFNSLPMSGDALRALRGAHESVIVGALARWRRQRYQPCILDLRQLPSGDDAVAALVADGYTEFLVHGLTRPARADEVESLFIFGSPHGPVPSETLRYMDMLLPMLHMTYQRVHAIESGIGQSSSHPIERGVGSTGGGGRLAVTEREREILMWVRDGMSNHQISEKLGISALTVKNHVQKILRKLGASNRAQAVGKAMNMNLLSNGREQEMG